jgi:hypothetical protein
MKFLILALLPIVLGVAIGYLTGGRLSALFGQFRALWLLWLAVAVQTLHNRSAGARHLVADRVGVSLLAVVFGIGLLWLALNLRPWRPIMRCAGVLVLIGAAANCAAIAANGRMPYSVTAAAIAGVPPGATTPKNEPALADSRLTYLGDVIPIPGLHKIASVGDVLIATGTIVLLAAAMRRRDRTEIAGPTTEGGDK